MLSLFICNNKRNGSKHTYLIFYIRKHITVSLELSGDFSRTFIITFVLAPLHSQLNHAETYFDFLVLNYPTGVNLDQYNKKIAMAAFLGKKNWP